MQWSNQTIMLEQHNAKSYADERPTSSSNVYINYQNEEKVRHLWLRSWYDFWYQMGWLEHGFRHCWSPAISSTAVSRVHTKWCEKTVTMTVVRVETPCRYRRSEENSLCCQKEHSNLFNLCNRKLFLAHFGPINTSDHLSATGYFSIVAEYVRPLMATIFYWLIPAWICTKKKSSQTSFMTLTMGSVSFGSLPSHWIWIQ